MAAFSSFLAAGGLALSAGTTIDGISKSNQAKEQLANLEVPELENPSENIQISTKGSDIIREEAQRRTANILDSLNGSDSRTVLSALPSLVATNDRIIKESAMDIDKQMIEREYRIAGYDERLNEIEEDRYQGELAGIGGLYNLGQSQVWNGINGTLTAAGSLGRSIDSNKISDPNKD